MLGWQLSIRLIGCFVSKWTLNKLFFYIYAVLARQLLASTKEHKNQLCLIWRKLIEYKH